MAIEQKGKRVLIGAREFARDIHKFPEVRDVHIGETDTGMSGRERHAEFKIITATKSVLITLMLGEGQQKYHVFPMKGVTSEVLLVVLVSRISPQGRVLPEHMRTAKPPSGGSIVASEEPEESLVLLVREFVVSLEEARDILRLCAAAMGGELPAGATTIVGRDLWALFKRRGYITSVGAGRASVATIVWVRFEETRFVIDEKRTLKQSRFFLPADEGAMRGEDAWHLELQKAVDGFPAEEEDPVSSDDADLEEPASSVPAASAVISALPIDEITNVVVGDVAPLSPTLVPPPPVPSLSVVRDEKSACIVAPPAPLSVSLQMPVVLDLDASLAELESRLANEMEVLLAYEAREIVPARQKIAVFEERRVRIERFRSLVQALRQQEAAPSTEQ